MKKVVTRRTASLLAILAMVSLAWAFDAYQNRVLAKELDPFAAKHVEEFKDANTQVASLITVSRKYVLFGEPLAKVEVFVKANTDTEEDGVRGIEYEYRRENGNWTMVESGSCTSEECQLRARTVLHRLTPR